MKIFFQLLVLFLCVSNHALGYFQTNTAKNVLGFVPVGIILDEYLEELNSEEFLDIDFFNTVLQTELTVALVECEGTTARLNFRALYKKLLLNILVHADLKTKKRLKLPEKPTNKDNESKINLDPEKIRDEDLPIDETNPLASEIALEEANQLIINDSQCKPISDAYVTVPQVKGIKKTIDASITRTFVDWLKENQTYFQSGWQLLIWGSALSEWYFGHTDLIAHFLEYSKTYLRVIVSAAPLALQLYHSYSRPLTPTELSSMAIDLQTMADIKVRLIDNNLISQNMSPNNLDIMSLRYSATGMVYERYLRLKALLKGLVESNPTAIISNEDVRGRWRRHKGQEEQPDYLNHGGRSGDRHYRQEYQQQYSNQSYSDNASSAPKSFGQQAYHRTSSSVSYQQNFQDSFDRQ